MQQAEHIEFLEAFATLQEVKLYGESQAGNLTSQLIDQLHRRLHGSSGSQQVVDQHHPLAGRNGVQVDLQRVRAVLQIVGNASHRSRKLARLAHRHKASVQPVGQRWSKDESTRLNAQHQVDLLLNVVRGQHVS